MSKIKELSCKFCSSLSCTIFSEASEHEIELLDGCKTTNRYRRGQVVFYEGTPLLGIYFIRSGKIKLYKTSEDGKQQILRIAVTGDVMGHSSLFTNRPHLMTAEVMEETAICYVEKNGFRDLLTHNADIAVKLLARLSHEIISAEEKALDLAYESVRVRFVKFLLTLKQSFGVYEQGAWRLEILLSREEIAQAIGATVETAVRLMSEFRAEGWISEEQKRVIIRNSEKLMSLTESGY